MKAVARANITFPNYFLATFGGRDLKPLQCCALLALELYLEEWRRKSDIKTLALLCANCFVTVT